MVCFNVEVGIIMTGLGYGLEPPYICRSGILVIANIILLIDKNVLKNRKRKSIKA